MDIKTELELNASSTSSAHPNYTCDYLQLPNFQLHSSIQNADSYADKAKMWITLPSYHSWLDIFQTTSHNKDQTPPSPVVWKYTMFLQEWLVFSLLGTIAVIFGVKINIKDFLMRERADKWLVDLDRIQPFSFSLSASRKPYKLGYGPLCTPEEDKLVGINDEKCS